MDSWSHHGTFACWFCRGTRTHGADNGRRAKTELNAPIVFTALILRPNRRGNRPSREALEQPRLEKPKVIWTSLEDWQA
jgi:hypothetical protein